MKINSGIEEQYSLAKNRHKRWVSLNVHGKYNYIKVFIMKKLKLNLKGAKALNKAEQRQINGGYQYGSACFSCANLQVQMIKNDSSSDYMDWSYEGEHALFEFMYDLCMDDLIPECHIVS